MAQLQPMVPQAPKLLVSITQIENEVTSVRNRITNFADRILVMRRNLTGEARLAAPQPPQPPQPRDGSLNRVTDNLSEVNSLLNLIETDLDHLEKVS